MFACRSATVFFMSFSFGHCENFAGTRSEFTEGVDSTGVGAMRGY